MEYIMINIKELGYSFLKEEFKGEDIISLEDLLGAYEERVYDVERLEDEIRELKNYDEQDAMNGYLADVAYEEEKLNGK